ncbi:ABC transporter substrate-binding protein [Pusillimonas sp. DMV24BSW_D]|jgi:branched-chain amino acid transport system substrate-binding protein|uniref:ABC transporter substrate-binding protein n=1 Tax=Neopusillimonas aestuarii TaxID=2716226 RepID=UPI000C4F08E7|nr:ABC transporter substrate-binding protein [Pusillimonas sp. DMV24BSW_D]MBF23691.1 ABC transporter permease [Pusillimonas sp.]QIM48898.1 ABC transporter substrate-binding protein [Pusillimonas sp. DMV24BSW_D]|tara:strand:+ start:14157 stop:15317 length:1161 start_codon:yes stop_codon:yes gene_type:complete
MKKVLTGTALALSLAFGAGAASAEVKVGFMLPYSGTYAQLGEAIENGFKMYVEEQGGKLAGQEVTYFRVDDESNPSKGPDNANRLIKRDNVDVLIGTVHSGVAMALAKAATENDVTLIIPNAGAVAITGPLCSKNVFRSSFSNWQPGYAMGVVAAEDGHKKAVTISWNYAAGKESTDGFKEAFEKGGGEVVEHLTLPFPQVEFQPLLTEIASIKPDVVYTFFAGGGAVKFVQDYAAAGLKDQIPLVGAGFLTDGTLKAQGESAQGLRTALHYADGLDNDLDKEFRENYSEKYPDLPPDVYAVQGYDAAQMLAAGMEAVDGDISKKDQMRDAIRNATIKSPRGDFTISKSGNPVQDFYLREVKGMENVPVKIAVEDLADPSRGCKLM